MEKPSNLVVTGMSKGATSGDVYVHLTWRDNSTNEDGFELYQSIADTSNYKLIKTTSTNNVQYKVNLGNNPQNAYYYYKVRAINSTGKSEFSNEVNTKYGTLPTPNAPSEFSVNSVTKGSTSGDFYINVAWKDNSDNEKYFKVYQSVGDKDNYKLIKTPPANSQDYGINIGSNIQQGNYFYKATAVNDEGESPASNTAEKFIGVKAPSDVNVSNVVVSSANGRYFVNLNWKDNSDNETGFEILESIGNQDNFKVIKTPAANSQNYGIDIGANPTLGTRYYKVVAKNSVFISEDSNITQAEIKPASPSAPTNVEVKNITKGATTGNIYVNLIWSDTSDNEDSFKIYQAVNSTTDFKEIKTADKDSQSYGINIGSNPESGAYYYKIQAVNTSGVSPDSNTASTNIGGVSINAPSNLRIESATRGRTSGDFYINLRWNDNSDNETGFEILHSLNSTNNFKVIKTPNANVTSYGVNIGSNPGQGIHYFVIRAKKGNSYSGYSNTVSKALNY